MSSKSTHCLLLHDGLIKSCILSKSFVQKKKANNVFVHHECDGSCWRYSGNQQQNEIKHPKIGFTEMTANHISSNPIVSKKLSITFKLTSGHWESILCKILSLHRAKTFEKKTAVRRDLTHCKIPNKLATVSQEQPKDAQISLLSCRLLLSQR